MPVSRVRKKKSKNKNKPKSLNVIDGILPVKKALLKRDKRGLLPVRVLCGNLVDVFFNISPDFKKEFEKEVSKGLHDKIIYHIQRDRIRRIAQLNSRQQIELFENFNQYLWAMSHSLLVLFDKGIHEPRLKGIFSGSFADSPEVADAWDLFKAGLSLKDKYSQEIFFHLPNPEINQQEEYILKANSLYLAALNFILLHEFGHQYFGHYNPSSSIAQAKADEHLVDDFAINKMSSHFDGQNGKTLKGGILVGALSLLFLKRVLGGGDTHPDFDVRLKTIIERLALDDIDNLWGIASMAISLWSNEFEKDVKIPKSGETYKEIFYVMLKDLERLR
jgi:hypothetical protein